MPVQTYEAITDDSGNVRFADAVRLPAHTKVYVVVPEQTTAYTAITPEINDLPSSAMRLPLVRVTEAELAKRLVKTVVEETHAGL